ncbi:DNA-processing protein DprA [soil metagenome]
MIPAQDAREAWLTLLGSGLDRSTIALALQTAVDARELLDASDAELASRFDFSPRAVEAIRRTPGRETVARQLRAMDEHGMDLIPLNDPGFPRNLFHMRVPPPAVFVKGKIEDYDSLAVGIVGPRAATNYAVDVARRLATDFAPNLTVISGAAMGIDSTAHEAVLNAGGRTIGVLGCGIDINYPSGNGRLRQRITEQGALLSIFPPGTKPLPGHFPMRNFVLAGLSLAVVVVEASKTSGGLVTARAAGEEGRPVYAVPGDITRKNSEGSNLLIRDGAILCTSAADVIVDLEATLHGELEMLRRRRLTPAKISPAAGRPQPAAPDALQSALLDLINHSPAPHDSLLDRFVPDRCSLGELSSALLMLEFAGRIQQLPGRVYAPKL